MERKGYLQGELGYRKSVKTSKCTLRINSADKPVIQLPGREQARRRRMDSLRTALEHHKIEQACVA